MDNHPEKSINLGLENQLKELVTACSTLHAASVSGNAIYYLNKIANYIISRGIDEPMIADIWLHDDLNGLVENEIDRNLARNFFGFMDRTFNTETGINWDVLKISLIDFINENQQLNR